MRDGFSAIISTLPLQQPAWSSTCLQHAKSEVFREDFWVCPRDDWCCRPPSGDTFKSRYTGKYMNSITQVAAACLSMCFVKMPEYHRNLKHKERDAQWTKNPTNPKSYCTEVILSTIIIFIRQWNYRSSYSYEIVKDLQWKARAKKQRKEEQWLPGNQEGGVPGLQANGIEASRQMSRVLAAETGTSVSTWQYDSVSDLYSLEEERKGNGGENEHQRKMEEGHLIQGSWWVESERRRGKSQARWLWIYISGWCQHQLYVSG